MQFNINPIRYRGYYLDTETGYYYLQSRYYDPVIGRFISPDAPEYVQLQKNDYAGINSYLYCCNDPVNNVDNSGNGVLQTILDVLGKSLDTLIKIIDFISNSCAKSVKNLEEKAERYNKANKRKKAFQDVVDESDKLSKKLGKVGKIISCMAILTGLFASCRSGIHWTVMVVQVLVDLLTDGISSAITQICKRLARMIPGVGFIVSIVASISVSMLLSRYFNDTKVNEIANSVWSYIKNRKISSISSFLKITLKTALS